VSISTIPGGLGVLVLLNKVNEHAHERHNTKRHLPIEADAVPEDDVMGERS